MNLKYANECRPRPMKLNSIPYTFLELHLLLFAASASKVQQELLPPATCTHVRQWSVWLVDPLCIKLQKQSPTSAIATAATRREVGHIPTAGQGLCNVPRSVDPPNLDKTVAVRCESLRDQVGSLCLTLGPNYCRALLLLRLLNEEFTPLSLLLCHLLLLHRSREILTIRQVSDGNIIQKKVEILCTQSKIFTNLT